MDYKTESYNSGFLVDKDYLPYEAHLNDEVLGLIFRVLFGNFTAIDSLKDFSGFKEKAFNKGLIQDATVFGGFNLASSFYDGSKDYSKYLGLDLIGVEFAKDPSRYTASRIVNNMKRNNLISVASTSTKDWFIKNGYKGDILVGNPICLLYTINYFKPKNTAIKSRTNRYAFITGPGPEDVTEAAYAEYNNIQSVLTANGFTDLGNESPSIYNTLVTLKETRCVVTNSATIYEAAVICGSYPIFLKTSYNDCEYAVRAFCKDMNIPFVYTFLDTLMSDYNEVAISENEGSFWNHDFSRSEAADYRLLGNPFPAIQESAKATYLSFPIEWYPLCNNNYFANIDRTQLYLPEFGCSLEFPTNIKIVKKPKQKFFNTLTNIEDSYASATLLQRFIRMLGFHNSIESLYWIDKDVTNELTTFGKIMYLFSQKSSSTNVVQLFLQNFFKALQIYDKYYLDDVFMESLGKDSLHNVIAFGLFIKEPSFYSKSRIRNSLDTKQIDNLALSEDKNYLASIGALHNDVPVVNPLAWTHYSNAFQSYFEAKPVSLTSSYFLSKEAYRNFKSYNIETLVDDNNKVLSIHVPFCVDIPDLLSDADKQNLLAELLTCIYQSPAIFTDSIYVYMLGTFLKKPCYYYSNNGLDKGTFNQFHAFAHQCKIPLASIDRNSQKNVDYWSDEIIYKDEKVRDLSVDNEVYEFLKWIKANFFNYSVLDFIKKVNQENNICDIRIDFTLDDSRSRAEWEAHRQNMIREYSSNKYKIVKYKEGPFGIMIEDGYEDDPLYVAIVNRLKQKEFMPISIPSMTTCKWYVAGSKYFRNGNDYVNRSVYTSLPDSMSKYSICQSSQSTISEITYNGYKDLVNTLTLDKSFVLNVYVQDTRRWSDNDFTYTPEFY